MTKRKSKARQRLARLVMAALLCTSGVQIIAPAVAYADDVPTVTITGTTDPWTVEPNSGAITVSSGDVYPTDPSTTTFNILSVTSSGNSFYGAKPWDPGFGEVSGRTVSVSGSTLDDVYGGAAEEASANKNTVTISGNSTVDEVYGGEAYNYVEVDIAVSTDGNTVKISDSTVNNYVYGGEAYGYDASTVSASGNTVTISNGSVDEEIYGGYAYGAEIGYNATSDTYTGAVSADGNTVEISGNSTASYVVGGYISSAYYTGAVLAGGNTVEISGNSTVDDVYGGYIYEAYYTGDVSASNNTITISDSTVDGGVTGGYIYYAYYTGDVSSSGNTVTISGSTVNSNITGGRIKWFDSIGYNSTTGEYTGTVSASNNVVTISDSTVEGDVTGGYIYDGYYAGAVLVGNNAVTISNSSVSGNVYGGTIGSAEDVDNVSASDNTVTISNNSTIEGDIYGGFAKRYGGTAVANNNTVNILTPIVLGGLYGGVTFGDAPRGTGTGNTLNLAAKNVTAREVYGFQNMNFYLPADIAKGDTMLTVNGDDSTDVKGVTFGVAALQNVELVKGDTVNLLVNSNGLITDDELQTVDSSKLASASFLAPNNLATDKKYELSISKKDDNTIITTVEDVKEVTPEPDSSDRLKSPVETRMAMATMINAGSDLLAGQGILNAETAAGEKGGGGLFATISGNHLRGNSGSHVTTKGLGLNLGFAKEVENKSGKLVFGPVIEYGHGKYDSYQDNGIKADGKASYWGLGLIAKQTNDNGFYYEGSLRVGRTKSDYSSQLSEVAHADYDSSATYWAAHLGAGKLVDIGHDNTMDYYGKYFYSHTGSDSAMIHINGQDDANMNFDSVNSHRLRVGAKLIHALNEKNKIYGGLAWQYEFNGEARATYRGDGTPSPSIKGSSGMIELGWQVKPGKGSMAIDFGVTGWVGKQRGVSANLQANWTF